MALALHGAGSDFLAAAAGGAHSCAIRVGGTLVCWETTRRAS